jgi:ribosomal protein S18 acetylase RimI-like enzyme
MTDTRAELMESILLHDEERYGLDCLTPMQLHSYLHNNNAVDACIVDSTSVGSPKLVGYGIITRGHKNIWRLRRLVVTPDYQQRGHANQMHTALITTGFRYRCTVPESDVYSQVWLSRKGWRAVGIHYGYLHSGGAVYEFTLDLR